MIPHSERSIEVGGYMRSDNLQPATSRTGQDRTKLTFKLTFQVTCDWQLSQFLRCLNHASPVYNHLTLIPKVAEYL